MFSDFKSALALLCERLVRLHRSGIGVRPLSSEWCRQHERDAAKRAY